MANNLDFHEKFGSEMARISTILLTPHCHRAIFFTLAPPLRAPPFLVRATGPVLLIRHVLKEQKSRLCPAKGILMTNFDYPNESMTKVE